MKTKLKYLIMVLAVVPFFMSCSEDVALPLTLDKNDLTLDVDQIMRVKITQGNGGYKVLTTDATIVTAKIEDESVVIEAIGVGTATVTVSDKESKSSVINVKVKGEQGEPEDTPLSATQAFEWKRSGAPAGTGLDKFGLAWTSNGLEGNFAIVKKDAATKFVQLTAADWSAITTKEALKDAVDKATGITEYKGVSATKTADYNDVLAVLNGDVYYIINVKRAVVVSISGGSTTITITGDYKN